MEGSVIFRKQQRINGLGQLSRAGGGTELIPYHRYHIMIFGKPEHGLGKVLAIAVQPGRPQNKIPVRKILHKILACQLGGTVSAMGIGGIRLHIGLCRFSVKYIVRGNMHQLCAGLPCRNGQVPGADGIDFKSLVIFRFTGIHARMGRAVDDCIGLYFPCQLHYLINISNVQLSHIRVHKADICRIFKKKVNSPSQLSVASGYNYFLHRKPPNSPRTEAVFLKVRENLPAWLHFFLIISPRPRFYHRVVFRNVFSKIFRYVFRKAWDRRSDAAVPQSGRLNYHGQARIYNAGMPHQNPLFNKRP